MSEYDARLTDRVRTRGTLKPDDAATFLLPVAESLAALHAAGGTHGALSPAAIRVDVDGLATLLEPTIEVSDPDFTAPDPTWGLRPHPASNDVWSFAAVLLHVTTGRTPVATDADPRQVGWLAPLIELAMQPDPHDRPSMADVVDYLRARVIPEQEPRRVSGLAMVVTGTIVILGLAIAGAALLFGADTATDDSPPPTSTPTTSGNGPPSADQPTATASAEPVTAADLENFARTYVDTASSDPDRGYQLLTRNYQQASPRYRAVWAAIENPEIVSVGADPETLSVSYTYTYLFDGARRTEDVTLRLVQQGRRLLIAGATGRLR